MPGLRIRRQPSPKPSDTVSTAARCRIPTLIKRATGSGGRYALSAVRALPLRYRGHKRSTSDPAFRHNVVLQASDGHQAVCVLTEGAIEQPTLIPGEVLPTRQADRNSGVSLDGQAWRSKHGEEAEALDSQTPFPPIGPVLPETGPDTTAVAINVDRLRCVAAGLGTDNLTLLVPAAKKKPGASGGQLTVRDPIAVCPAGKEDIEGVAVMLPVECERSHAYYNRIREAIVKAEQPRNAKPPRCTKKPSKEVAA